MRPTLTSPRAKHSALLGKSHTSLLPPPIERSHTTQEQTEILSLLTRARLRQFKVLLARPPQIACEAALKNFEAAKPLPTLVKNPFLAPYKVRLLARNCFRRPLPSNVWVVKEVTRAVCVFWIGGAQTKKLSARKQFFVAKPIYSLVDRRDTRLRRFFFYSPFIVTTIVLDASNSYDWSLDFCRWVDYSSSSWSSWSVGFRMRSRSSAWDAHFGALKTLNSHYYSLGLCRGDGPAPVAATGSGGPAPSIASF